MESKMPTEVKIKGHVKNFCNFSPNVNVELSLGYSLKMVICE